METIHYRCTFDLEPAEGAAVGFVDLVRMIASWIGSKEGRWDGLRPQALLRDGESRSPKRSTVRTACISDSDRVLPEIWALRYLHQDAEFVARSWQTDFGVTQLAARRWRLSVTVGNSLRADFIGKEPERLPVTPPRVVRQIVASNAWNCFSGSTQLRPEPQEIAVGQGNLLRDAIADPNRACPLVYVSCERESRTPSIDVSRLAGRILGVGVVYVAQSSDVDEELEHLIEREYRSPNGMVRVYGPGVDLKDVRASFRHRFFPRQRIVELGAAEVEDQIARSLARRLGWANVRSSVSSVDDVAIRVRELRLAKLRESTGKESQAELLKLYADEVDRLTAESQRLSSERAQAEEGREEALLKVEDLNDKLRGREYEISAVRKEAEDARREAAAYRGAATAARELARLPQSLPDVVDLIEKLHAGRVVFTERARESAKKAAINESSMDDAWECLFSVSSALPRLAFDDQIGEGALPERFRDLTGFELSLTEGKATKNDAKFLSIRKVKFDGQEWDIKPHVKLGTKGPKLLRVHFALDHDKRRIIVGHCGDHLDTAGTRRH